MSKHPTTTQNKLLELKTSQCQEKNATEEVKENHNISNESTNSSLLFSPKMLRTPTTGANIISLDVNQPLAKTSQKANAVILSPSNLSSDHIFAANSGNNGNNGLTSHSTIHPAPHNIILSSIEKIKKASKTIKISISEEQDTPSTHSHLVAFKSNIEYVEIVNSFSCNAIFC